MASNESVPHFILALDEQDDTVPEAERRTKALFTVPKELASQLAMHAILCRGSCFELQVEKQSPRNGGTTFLSTIFKSPQPQALAHELAKRIAIRMDNVDQFQETAGEHEGGAADVRSMLGF